jgi:hypothetical protein
MIPVWHDERAYEPDHRVNKVVELRTNHVVAVIHAKPGYNRALNFHETARRVGRQIRLFCSEKSVANGIPTLWF